MSEVKTLLGGINNDDLKKLQEKLNAFNHPIRKRIIDLLANSIEINVTQIQTKLRINDQSVLSLHLSILRKWKYVNVRRDGKFMFYSVNMNEIENLNDLINAINK